MISAIGGTIEVHEIHFAGFVSFLSHPSLIMALPCPHTNYLEITGVTDKDTPLQELMILFLSLHFLKVLATAVSYLLAAV